MKSIEIRFAKQQESYPKLSSHTNFANAIKDARFAPKTIHRWFNRLVDKDDYSHAEKRAVLAYLVELSNPLRTTEIEGKSPRRESRINNYVVQGV